MAARDPFSSVPDTAAYLPRAATERALDLLDHAIASGDRPVLLEGPHGIGKTLLLHLLADQFRREQRPVAVPIPTLSPSELWHWVVSMLGVAAGDEPLAALAESLRSGPPVLLLIDDANSLPAETLESLAEALAAHQPALRAVLVANDDEEESSALREAFGDSLERVRFFEPMNEAECATYVRKRLDSAGVDEPTRARFDDRTLALLHERSGGVPALVHEFADVLVRPDEAARAHELAAELRPDVVASAAARRSRESVERVADWGDEDLAMTVAARSRPASGASEVVESLESPELFAPEEEEGEPGELVAASRADAAQPSSPDASEVVRAAGVAAPDPAPDPAAASPASKAGSPATAKRPPKPALPQPRQEPPSRVGPIALAAAVLLLLAGAATWHFDLWREPQPTHTARLVSERPSPSPAPEAPAAPALGARPSRKAAPERVADPVLDRSAEGAVELAADAAAESAEGSAAESAEEGAAEPAEEGAVELAANSAFEPVEGSALESAAEGALEVAAEAEAARAPVLAVSPSQAPDPEPAPSPDLDPGSDRGIAPAPTRATPAPETVAASTPETPARPEPAPVVGAEAEGATEPAAEAAAESEPRPAPALAGQRPPQEIAVVDTEQSSFLARLLAPAGTRIEIDDGARGTAPLAAVILSEGDHRVRWVLPDGAVSERVFRVDAEHTTLDLMSEPADGEENRANPDAEPSGQGG